jgi:hypothetical protein
MSTTNTPNPYPYLNADELERRLDSVQAIKTDVGLGGSDWDQLVEDIISENSAWVHRIIVQQGVTPDGYAGTDEFLRAWPEVRQAMVRLCRYSIQAIEQSGLESESAEDRSESYRPPEAVRQDVRAYLEGVEPEDSDGGTGDDGFRSTIL